MRIQIGEWQIRSFRAGDATALVKYGNNRNVSIHLRDAFPHPYTLNDANAWLLIVLNQAVETNLAIASETELIGGIGLNLQEDVHRYCAEMGYWLGEPHWGKGIATRAVRAFTEFAFDSFELIRMYAYVFEGNVASERVLQKAGYVLEGCLRKSVVKEGRLLDQLIYAIVRP
ncbi:MAG: GNAT family N-acetyltransferase [Candidatus Krumholzibacteriia bacterium]